MIAGTSTIASVYYPIALASQPILSILLIPASIIGGLLIARMVIEKIFVLFFNKEVNFDASDEDLFLDDDDYAPLD